MPCPARKASSVCTSISKIDPIASIEYLCNEPEHQYLERKGVEEKSIKPSKLADEIIGMLNADGGIIALGISDDGTLQDLQTLDPKLLNSYECVCQDFVKPPANVELENLTAREYLTFIGRMYLLPASTIRQRADELLTMMELAREEKKLTLEFSHGMRKKTALAMALLPNPKVLFLDEPFEGIDPVAARTIQELLLTISKRGITIFFTSHILSMVDRLATEVLMIRSAGIDPLYVAVHMNLAFLYVLRNAPEKTISELKEVVKLEPHNIEANYKLGRLLLARDRTENRKSTFPNHALAFNRNAGRWLG